MSNFLYFLNGFLCGVSFTFMFACFASYFYSKDTRVRNYGFMFAIGYITFIFLAVAGEGM